MIAQWQIWNFPICKNSNTIKILNKKMRSDWDVLIRRSYGKIWNTVWYILSLLKYKIHLYITNSTILSTWLMETKRKKEKQNRNIKWKKNYNQHQLPQQINKSNRFIHSAFYYYYFIFIFLLIFVFKHHFLSNLRTKTQNVLK